jgi:hypothetical protein
MNTDVGVAVAGGGLILFFQISLIVISVIGMWKLFSKAGKPGWATIVPVYNTIVLIDIAKKPLWWILLLFIPIVNIVFAIKIMASISKNFGRGTGTTVGLIFLPMIFMLILGFGSAEYKPVEG